MRSWHKAIFHPLPSLGEVATGSFSSAALVPVRCELPPVLLLRKVADYKTAWLESQLGSSATEGPTAHVAHRLALVCRGPLGPGTQVAGTMLTLFMLFL